MTEPKRTWPRTLLRSMFRLLLGLTLFTVLLVGIYRFLPVTWTPLMGIRAWEGIPARERVRVSLGRMGHAPLAVIGTEDQRFFDHWGFDIEAIRDAIQYNGSHRRTRGASTISQQTAKNLFLWPGRDWLRKGLEVWLTLWIEALWPKERILEHYLNVIEFGPGVYGIEAAARHWYRKPAAALTRDEAASLAVILPSPLKSNPRRLGGYLTQRKGWALAQMRNLGPLPVETRRGAQQQKG